MIDRRHFTLGMGAAAGALGVGPATAQSPYTGPNVVIIRFGGGVRRLETIDPAGSYAPYMMNVLAPEGVLIPDLMIDEQDAGDTSHAEGTLNILTGRYKAYRDAGSNLFEQRLEPTEPTLFEYLRSSYGLDPHEALLINGEDRQQEEFLTYGVHGHYGVAYRSEMLSLHQFKLYKTRAILAEGGLSEDARSAVEAELDDLLSRDVRPSSPDPSAAIDRFWEDWRSHYGDSGLKNPRGDRLLTELALRAMASLRPRLMMVNYQDPDYVHWGNASHYTRAISVIDDGIRQIYERAQSDAFYAGNTIFVIVPDCGRDANDLLGLPFQHHFNTRSAHEIWALVLGPGIAKGRVMDRRVDQTAIAPTIAELMGFRADRAEGDVLSGLST